MITIEEAKEILRKIKCAPETEEVPLTESLGRVLGQDIVSPINMPPFNKSAMDGYALKADDPSKRYEIVEVIAAGAVPAKTIQTGQCAKIMTGAMVPEGANRVVKVEVTEERGGFMRITEEDPNINICYLGEDVKTGTTILKRGHFIRPQEVGVIASMGKAHISVYKRPKLGIITTGTEIKEPGQNLEKGQIYNSNAYSIGAQARLAGADVTYAGVVSDNVEEIRTTIHDLLSKVQMVLISGGVSMGDYDFVPAILKDLGVQLHFDKVAIQPGKPTVFGTHGSALVFGMPGNPVSTFTIFEIFVKPVLYCMTGYNYSPSLVQGIMKKDFERRRCVRTLYAPVLYDNDGFVEPVEYHGSAHLTALPYANGLLEVPVGVLEIPKGSVVHVRQV